MDRRGFLRALLATSVAPMVMMIPEAALADDVDYEGILSGETPAYVGLFNQDGLIRSIEPQRFETGVTPKFNINSACEVTHAALLTEDFGMIAPIFFSSRRYCLMSGDTLNILGISYNGA